MAPRLSQLSRGHPCSVFTTWYAAGSASARELNRCFNSSENSTAAGQSIQAAHALTARLTEPDLKFPYLCLLVSGGHTLLALVKNAHTFQQVRLLAAKAYSVVLGLTTCALYSCI